MKMVFDKRLAPGVRGTGEVDLVRSRIKSCKSLPEQHCTSVVFDDQSSSLQIARLNFTGHILKVERRRLERGRVIRSA